MPPARKRTAKKTATKKKTAKKTTARKRPGPRSMSAAHKSALAQGREQSLIVDRYLRAVAQPKRRGRKVTKEALATRLAVAEKRGRDAIGLDRVVALQEVRDLRARLAATETGNGVDIAALERDFVKIAAAFSEKRGISYGTWRDAGVQAEVLSKAGIRRTRG